MLNCMMHTAFLLFTASVPAPGILHSPVVHASVLNRIDHLIVFAKPKLLDEDYFGDAFVA